MAKSILLPRTSRGAPVNASSANSACTALSLLAVENNETTGAIVRPSTSYWFPAACAEVMAVNTGDIRRSANEIGFIIFLRSYQTGIYYVGSARMAGFILTNLAAGGLTFALQESTVPGRVIILLLFVGSIFSWSVMITKIRMIQYARRQSRDFMAQFRANRQPLRIYEEQELYRGAPLFRVYRAGCRELTFHMLGSPEVDETFRGRLESAPRINPAQMRAVTSAMERAVGENGLKLESQLILLATAVSGAPFLGLLGTVWGVMDTFSDIAAAGSASLTAMAPGVSAALLTTVTGLLVAIPAMFGYNFLVTSIRAMIVEMDNFAAELASEIEHRYVDHGSTRPALFRTSP
jgi:biopolymer transport protein TolQ